MQTNTFQVMGFTCRANGSRVEVFHGDALQAIVAIHEQGIFTVTEWAKAGAGRLPSNLQRDVAKATEFALRAYWSNPATAKAA